LVKDAEVQVVMEEVLTRVKAMVGGVEAWVDVEEEQFA